MELTPGLSERKNPLYDVYRFTERYGKSDRQYALVTAKSPEHAVKQARMVFRRMDINEKENGTRTKRRVSGFEAKLHV